MFKATLLTAIGASAAFLASGATAQVQVDARIPTYQKSGTVSGSIQSVGSDTMNNLMTLWAEGFQKQFPNAQVEIEGKGSGTAPVALIEGTANFGPMSRAMKSTEVDKFEKAFGYKPTQLPTSIDMLAVYVHKDNPIAELGLSLEQVDAIFSKNRKGGAPKDIRTWGDLGLTGEWAKAPISVFGRNSASGTYGYFKKQALFGGDFKDSVKEQPGSSSVVQGVATDKFAIGYSGIGYLTADVRAVPLSKGEGEKVPAAAARAKEYPLSRFLYVSVNYKPNSQLDPLRREFLRYVFSREGQLVVVKDGYLPLTFEVCKRSLQQVGLDLEPVEGVVEASSKN